MMNFKTLDNFDFKNKFVIVRADINSDVVSGKIKMNERIIESSKTILELLNKKAKVVVIAHQGNPGKDDFINLSQHAKLLNEFVRIKFIDDIVGEKAIRSIKSLKAGEALLLDNIRNLEEEIDPSKTPNRIKALGKLFDIYVNDAFSVCHRAHSSIVELPKSVPFSCVGRILEKELKALEKISINDCIYLLGGAKPEENIKLLKGKKVLSGGLFAQLCLVASGKNLGYQNEFLKKATLIKGDYNEFLKLLKTKLTNVEMPVDFAVDENGERREYSLEEFPLSYEIEDIGAKTLSHYLDEINKASAIYMKGPFGNTSIEKYAKGTIEILKAISKSKAFSLIGGGHLSDAIKMSGIPTKKFGHISLSGGALLNYIAGEKLPGLVALGIMNNS
ncbi:MAG: phosphoglycerate kinase [Candidatus Pacearchaeota archaeon]